MSAPRTAAGRDFLAHPPRLHNDDRTDAPPVYVVEKDDMEAAIAAIEAEAAQDARRAFAARLRGEFLRLLTEDSATKDRRRREYNQAIFNVEGGWAIWSSTDLDMVLSKFDKAVSAAEGEP